MKTLFSFLLILIGLYAPAQSFFTTVSGGCFNEGQSLELATKFTTSANATITGLRFYKCNNGTQQYVLKLYSGTTLLASGTYSNAATGWVTVPIAPQRIIPGVNYTVSYFSPGGWYQAVNQFSGWPAKTGALTATGSVYRLGANNNNVPATSYQTSNYFADVIAQADTATPPPAAPKDSITVDGVLYVKASTIKPAVKDSTVFPFDIPDSSTVMNLNGVNYKYLYFTKFLPAPDTAFVQDSTWALTYFTSQLKNGTIDFSQYYPCPDTSHIIIGYDALDTTAYETYFKNLRYFRVHEFSTFGNPLYKIRYVEYPKMAVRKEESLDGGLTWQTLAE